MSDIPVIAVDGPSGTGKGTVCTFLANWLGWHLLDSGALYRIMAYAAQKKGISLENETELAMLAADVDVRFEQDAQESRIILDNAVDISSAIRTEEAGNAASKVAALTQVRQALLERQRGFRQAPGLIADGRDMGTVVFPDARLKIYLTASAEERAKRRHKQLIEKGISVNLARLSAEISERDSRDKGRSVSPLKPAHDAIIIDSTELDIGAVCRKISEQVHQVFPGCPDTLLEI